MCAGAHMLMCLCGGQNATFKKLHVPICVCMCMMLHVWRSKNNLSINPFPPLYGSQGWSSMSSWLWVSCCWPTEGSSQELELLSSRCVWGALLPAEPAPVFLEVESPWTLTIWPASSKHSPLSTGITGACLLYCLWFKTIFKLKYLDKILSLPQVPPDPLPPPYHPTVSCLSNKTKQ